MNANAIKKAKQNDLVVVESLPLDQNPALIYLAGLNSYQSRRSQRQALEVIAEMLTGSRDILACNWAALRYKHTQAIRAQLVARYSAATVKRFLSALRGDR
jgi:hypothetical protein